MRYADYYDCDICNGKSVGMSLFVTGCPIHCQGCFNSDIWDFDAGKEWTREIEERFVKLAGREYIKRISFLGGSPLCDRNVEDVTLLIERLKYHYPDKKIWVYTGYTWDSITSDVYDHGSYQAFQFRKEALNYIDVLVDGPFELENKDLSLAFRGSSNQRIIDVPQSLKAGHVVLHCEDE